MPITVQVSLLNIYTIGGLRIGLSASGQVNSTTLTLQQLDFSQTFSQNGRMVGQNPNIALQLTKVINDTASLVSGNDEVLSGLWIGSFTMNYYESFFSDSDYLNAPAGTATNLTLAITETPYYILNSQSPIARLPEIIYHDLLFTIMILELFGLMFLIFKLGIIPLIVFLIRRWKPDCGNGDAEERSSGYRSSHGDLKIATSNSNEHKSREDMSSQHRSSHGDLKIPTSNSHERKSHEDVTEVVPF